MDRRAYLATLGFTLAALATGCTNRGAPTDTPALTPTPDGNGGTPTRTRVPQGTLEVTVTNDDDRAHEVRVTVTNEAGTAVEEAYAPGLQPGEYTMFGGVSPAGTYTVAVETGSDSVTYEWDTADCERVHLDVRITADGSLSVTEDLCRA